MISAVLLLPNCSQHCDLFYNEASFSKYRMGESKCPILNQTVIKTISRIYFPREMEWGHFIFRYITKQGVIEHESY